jgi:hypothetical protein
MRSQSLSFRSLSVLLLVFSLPMGCERPDDLQQAGRAIERQTAAQSPAQFSALQQGQPTRFSGTLARRKGGGSKDVCLCMQVCDSKGQNCTRCVCSPSNCGSC